jgi:hypothetical protein
MGSSRNRSAGHGLERSIVKELKELGYDAVTSRAESRNMDNRGIDIFSPPYCSNPLPVHIQCKNTVINPHYEDLLTSELLPNDKPTVVVHRKTKKANTRFVTQGDYVIIRKNDFYNLIKKTNG